MTDIAVVSTPPYFSRFTDVLGWGNGFSVALQIKLLFAHAYYLFMLVGSPVNTRTYATGYGAIYK